MKEIDLAIIGNIAFSREVTKSGEKLCIDGGAYCSAVSASSISKKIGLVSRVGPDFDLTTLTKREIDIEGVKVVPEGKTPVFTIYQHDNGTRTFVTPEMGLASEVDVNIFPESYLSAKYIYLATSLPEQHLIWIRNLETRALVKPNISASAFETYVREYPDLTREALQAASMVFLNEEELRTLRQFGELSFFVPVILTKGSLGAVYIEGETIIEIPAPRVNVIDTTGAGDILAGVFLAQRAQNIPIEIALERAVQIASQSITQFAVEHINPI